MALADWLRFVAIYGALCLIPGPSVLMVLGQVAAHGLRAGLTCIAGDLIAGLGVIVLAFAGLGAVLAASAGLFSVVKWAGVIWLAWLGLRQILSARHPAPVLAAGASARAAAFRAGFLTGILNPKAIVFYIAFLAQFMDPLRPAGMQLVVLAGTAAGVAGLVLGGYALLALPLRRLLAGAGGRQVAGYAGGGALLGGAGLMALHR